MKNVPAFAVQSAHKGCAIYQVQRVLISASASTEIQVQVLPVWFKVKFQEAKMKTEMAGIFPSLSLIV